MKISPININNVKMIPVQVKNEKNKEQGNINTQKNAMSPAYFAGQSQINSNLPISYTKLGEIPIPGLKEKASVFQLANGQRVIIAPKKGATVVKTTYHVGSLNETEDIRGISHFIEHNLFNGSKDLAPREYDKQVSDIGAYTNASTNFGVTDYFLSLQLLNKDSLEKAIRLNALQTQFPTFPVEQIEKEKEPVKSEIDMYKDIPSDVATSLVLKNLFNVNTNSTNFILGTKENINSFNRDKVLDYYNTWYTPDNAVTVITGDVDTNETIQLVSKYFNKKNDYSKINQRHHEPIKYNDKPIRTDIVRQNATTASVTMGFAVPEGTSKAECDKLSALMEVLTSSGSDLSKRLDKYGLSASIYTERMQNKVDGASAILITADAPEKQIEDVIKILYDEITKISNIPPSQNEVDIYKKRAINSVNSISETSSALNGALTQMALDNDYNYFYESLNNIRNITPQDISDTARKFLDLNKVSMCVSHEKTSTETSIKQNYNTVINKSNSVSFGAVPTDAKKSVNEITSNIKQYKLANNIKTMFISGNESAKASLWLNMESDELTGISSPAFLVLNELLNRGTQFKNKDTYNAILNSNDIGINTISTHNGMSVSADFTSSDISTVIQLINEMLLYPNFSEQEFERAKSVIRDNINSEEISAADKLNRELYPEIRIYESKEKRLQELEALTLQDIRNAYSLILSTAKCSAIYTGAVDKNQYNETVLNSELSKLPLFKEFNTIHSPNYYIYKPNTETKILAAADEKAQAEIIQAYKYKRSKNINDIVKIDILNKILGGSMSSRLFSDLRENKKLAYHVSSSICDENDCETIRLNIGTTTDSPNPNEGSPKNVQKALEGFEHNVNLLKTQNVSQKELENAKMSYKSDILDMLETNSDITTSYGSAKTSLYGINYYQQLFDAIEKITADDIRLTANYVFQNPPITSIVASTKTLKALNLQ